jgi:hypothetical protein
MYLLVTRIVTSPRARRIKPNKDVYRMSDTGSQSVHDTDGRLEQTLHELFEVVSQLENQPSTVRLLRRHLLLSQRANMEEESARALRMLADSVGCSPCACFQPVYVPRLSYSSVDRTL